MVTVPAGIVQYVPITLTNSQTANVLTGTQIPLTINWNTYSTYLDNPVDNYAFFDDSGNLLYSWLESGTANTTTNALVWVKLNAAITANGGTLNVNLGFYALGSNQLNAAGYTGEFPTATATYAQYDNGASVFAYYLPWGGLSALPSGWSASNTPTMSYQATYTKMTSSKTLWNFSVISASSPYAQANVPFIMDVCAIASVGAQAAFFGLDNALPTTGSLGEGIFPYQHFQLVTNGDNGSSGTTMANLDTSLHVFNCYFISASTGVANFKGSIDYGTKYNNQGRAQTAYTYFVYAVGGASTFLSIYWHRFRVYPPSNTMPASSFGALTPTLNQHLFTLINMMGTNMASHYLRKYGAAATIDFELYKLDGTGLKVDAASATHDIKIMKDEGAEADTTADAFVDEGQGYSLALSATEMTAARVVIYIVDLSSPQVWLDKTLIIETYGHASAQHADGAISAAIGTLVNAGGTATLGAMLGDFANSTLVTRTGNIQTEVNKIGTITNTGGTATIGAVFGDAANVSLASRIGTIDTVVDGIDTIIDNIHDTDLPAVKTDTAAIRAITDLLTLASIADAVHDEAIDGAVTNRQSMRLINSVLYGKLSGGGTNTLVYNDLADTKPRVTATMDATFNRTAVVKDAT